MQMQVDILTNEVSKLRNINLPARRHLGFCKKTVFLLGAKHNLGGVG